MLLEEDVRVFIYTPKTWKSPGIDGVVAELLEYGGLETEKKIWNYFLKDMNYKADRYKPKEWTLRFIILFFLKKKI